MLVSFSKFGFAEMDSIEVDSIIRVRRMVGCPSIIIEYGTSDDSFMESQPFGSDEARDEALVVIKIFINRAKAGLLEYTDEHVSLMDEYMAVGAHDD